MLRFSPAPEEEGGPGDEEGDDEQPVGEEDDATGGVEELPVFRVDRMGGSRLVGYGQVPGGVLIVIEESGCAIELSEDERAKS